MADANRGPGPIPERWLRCPRKAEDVLVKFLAFKTPLDEKFNDQVPLQYRFTPTMLFDYARSRRIKFGLWIDLTRTSRYYNQEQVKENDCRYVKIPCHGAEGAPDHEQTRTFIHLCEMFVARDPLSIIAVHCTHGFNRTGFLLAAFLIEHFDYSVEGAIREFAKVRPPGIYKEGYIRELYSRYSDDVVNVLSAPPWPSWCSYDDAGVDMVDAAGATNERDLEGGGGNGQSSRKRRSSARFKENPTFMEGVSGVEPITNREEVTRIRRRVWELTGSEHESFVGSQPISMDRHNIELLAEKPYRVSWKADGTRYMMLILGEGQIYFLDRDNSVFRVRTVRFFKRNRPTGDGDHSGGSSGDDGCTKSQPLFNTLLDGEMVIDEYNGVRTPRYLIYDLVVLEGCPIGSEPFYPTRYVAIEKHIIQPRVEAMMDGRIVREEESFSIRIKHFYELCYASRLLGEKFARQLTHAPDGLIFQPCDDPYTYGTAPTVLKWKPQSMNSIDFRLQVNLVQNVGCLPEYVGSLLTGSGRIFGKIKCDRTLRTLNGKIVECKLEGNRWVFMRERMDKSFPNSDSTAQAVYESIRSPVTQAMLLDFVKSRGYREPMPPPMAPPPAKRQRSASPPAAAKRPRTV